MSETIANKSYIGLSFDDGRIDNFTNVLPVLEKLGIPATFNITTGYIDGTLRQENKFCENPPMTIENIIRIADSGIFEIAAHGDQHLNDKKDILLSIEKLHRWGLKFDKIGFASPNHRLTGRMEEIQYLMEELELSYVRVGALFCKDLASRLSREITRITHSKHLFIGNYKISLMDQDMLKKRILFSCPVNHRMTFEQIKAFVDYAVENELSWILLFHSVLRAEEKFFGNYENVEYNVFLKICKYLSALRRDKRICICKTEDMLRAV